MTAYWTLYARAQLAREAAYGFMSWLLVWGALLGGLYVALHLTTKRATWE